MANALLSLGLGVSLRGSPWSPARGSSFQEFAEKTDAVSLADPGITTAAEFKDGKLMFGNIEALGN